MCVEKIFQIENIFLKKYLHLTISAMNPHLPVFIPRRLQGIKEKIILMLNELITATYYINKWKLEVTLKNYLNSLDSIELEGIIQLGDITPDDVIFNQFLRNVIDRRRLPQNDPDADAQFSELSGLIDMERGLNHLRPHHDPEEDEQFNELLGQIDELRNSSPPVSVAAAAAAPASKHGVRTSRKKQGKKGKVATIGGKKYIVGEKTSCKKQGKRRTIK